MFIWKQNRPYPFSSVHRTTYTRQSTKNLILHSASKNGITSFKNVLLATSSGQGLLMEAGLLSYTKKEQSFCDYSSKSSQVWTQLPRCATHDSFCSNELGPLQVQTTCASAEPHTNNCAHVSVRAYSISIYTHPPGSLLHSFMYSCGKQHSLVQ